MSPVIKGSFQTLLTVLVGIRLMDIIPHHLMGHILHLHQGILLLLMDIHQQDTLLKQDTHLLQQDILLLSIMDIPPPVIQVLHMQAIMEVWVAWGRCLPGVQLQLLLLMGLIIYRTGMVVIIITAAMDTVLSITASLSTASLSMESMECLASMESMGCLESTRGSWGTRGGSDDILFQASSSSLTDSFTNTNITIVSFP